MDELLTRPSLPLLFSAQYDFAVSYAAADRLRVSEIVVQLRQSGYRVFEYIDERVRSWGEPLADYLNDLFSRQACCYVIMWSSAYSKSYWALQEFKAVRAAATTWQRAVLIHLDDSKLPTETPAAILREEHSISASRQLSCQLAEFEAWKDSRALSAPMPLTLAATSGTSVARDLLIDGIERVQPGSPELSVAIRLTPDISSVFAAVENAVKQGGQDGRARAAMSKLVTEIESTHLPGIIKGLRQIIKLHVTSDWSPEETADAMEAYFLARCFGILFLFSGSFHYLRETAISDRSILKTGRSHDMEFAGALARVMHRGGLSVPSWLNVDLFSDNHKLSSLRKSCYMPVKYGRGARKYTKRELIRYLVPQLVSLAQGAPIGGGNGAAAFLEHLQSVKVACRDDKIIDAVTGNLEDLSN